MRTLKRRLPCALFAALLAVTLFPATALAAAPTIESAMVDQYNRLIVTFSEAIYGDSGKSTAVDKNDLVLTFTSNGGVATSATISSVNNPSNWPFQPGNNVMMIYFQLLPAGLSGGVETVEIKPASSTSIYNAAGEAMSDTQTTGAHLLWDMQPAFANGYPKANTAAADGSTEVFFEICPAGQEPVYVYYVAVPLGAGVPTKAQVLAEKDSTGNEPIKKFAASIPVSGASAYSAVMPAFNTMYDFYFVLQNAADDACDPVSLRLTTRDTSAPAVIAGSVSADSSTSATFNGSLFSTGGEAVTQHGFICGTDSNLLLTTPGATIVQLGAIGSPGDFTANVSGLKPATTYYARAYATNSKGTGLGEPKMFKTPASQTILPDAVRPEAVTLDVSGIKSTGATLTGRVTNDGGAYVRERGFLYALSADPVIGGSDVKRVQLGTGAGDFSGELTGLIPGTAYYARAYAVNSQGTAYGRTIRFETAQIGDSANGVPNTGGVPGALGYLLVIVSAGGLLLVRRRNSR